VLDPLGASLEAGPDQYAQLLRALSQSLVDCLGAPRSG
jgi:ABC-type Zn2+ transport system substrate-binding protein/surface adhesin